MEKLLSISIAAYNVADVIEKCLDSFVAAKTLKQIEVIVVDDGSKDNTADIVRTYVEKYPESIRLITKENGGHGSTINAALAVASGRYFKIVDGDDWVDPEGLDSLVAFLQETDVDLLFNNYNEVYPDHTVLKDVRHDYELNRVYSFEDMDPNQYIQMHASTVKLSAYRSVAEPISEHCFYVDTEFVYFIAMATETIVFHDACVYQYRLGQEGQSVSPQGKYNHIEDLMHISERMASIYTTHPVEGRVKKQFLFYLISSRVDMSLRWGMNFPKDDKDYLFDEYIKRFRTAYPEIFSQIDLGIYSVMTINASFSLFCGRALKRVRKMLIGR